MAPINNNKNPNIPKKQTGTVPKLLSGVHTNSNLVRDVPSAAATTKPTAASKARSNAPYRSTGSNISSRKNTEVVAPTRRELNDLNDYILSVTSESTKHQNSNTGNQPSGLTTSGQTHLDSTCFEFDNINFQENQRFCYPVRPIPRRNIINKQQSNLQEHNILPNNIPSSSAAAVGVVIPTTPGNSGLTEDNYNLLGNNNKSSSTIYQNILSEPITNNLQQQAQFDIKSDLSWEERLNFIQYFLSLTSKSNNNKDIIENHKMVNEKENNDEVYVNSTSLEDVAISESSDRAHSVSSIHTLNGAEPSTPNYEELQQQLEHSNRNIQNIKNQQQQLVQLQQAAKQHLSDMEDVRNQMPIRYGQNDSSSSGAPDYESVEQVHTDMSNLVNRMKNLQTFIQNQNDLSALLGEDSPDVLAEQELLQQKLNELKSHRVEMRNLVGELQDINNTAEKSIAEQNLQRENAGPTGSTSSSRGAPIEFQRVVPIELVGSRKKSPQVNNILENGHTDTEDDNDTMDAETAEMIQQKVADINSMKKQLQRLKDMMATVKLIEEKNESRSAKDVSIDELLAESNLGTPKGPIEVPATIQREFSKNFEKLPEVQTSETSPEEEAMSERVRLLHEMTSDLRQQAVGLASERDRLKVLKDELKRRRDLEGIEEKNSNRETGSPARMNANIPANASSNLKKIDEDMLKAEYEQKKKEFQKLCERLENEEQNDDTATVTGNEDNEEIDEENNERVIKNDSNFYSENWQRNVNTAGGINSCNSSLLLEKNSTVNSVNATNATVAATNRGKDSADSGAADVHGNIGGISLEAGSMQSGSSRSFSMPPPMRAINNSTWRKNSHDHSQVPPSGCDHFGMGLWNPFYFYNNPYGYLHPPGCGQPGNAGDFACPGHSWSNLGPNTASSTNGTQNVSNDPVLLQQFIQTQQMLINSVCQCNQMLWHQQREITNLNNTVAMLQERLLNATPDLQSISGNNRAESVPPLASGPNNLFAIGLNRAHSEQPIHASVTIPGPLYQQHPHQQQSIQTPVSPTRQPYGFNYNTSSNFQQQQQQQRRQHIVHNQNANAAYHTMAATSSNTSSAYNFAENSGSIYPGHPPHISYNNGQPMNFLNNDSTTQQTNHPAPPIFMNHHNNNIGTHPSHHAGNVNHSNSNLLQQNCVNSTNPPTSTGALNNQVPPGTRANNYWDNFRSYSRQNLLSSNSCKSNEESNHQMQQQHQHIQQQQQLHQTQTQTHQPIQQQLHPNLNINSSPFNVSPNLNINTNGCRNVQSSNSMPSSSNITVSNPSINSNNLNPPNFDSKYFHTFRNEFNSNGQSGQVNIPSNTANIESLNNVENNAPQSISIPFNSNIENQHLEVNQGGSASSNLSVAQSENVNENVFDFNNATTGAVNASSASVAAIFGSPDFRNMNFNFGLHETKKIPMKSSCNTTKRLRHTQSAPVNGNNENPFNLAVGLSENYHNYQQNDGHRYEEMGEGAIGVDETSEEIKRNLLVNALKSDKFTSKFFESLKEDVYRQAYAIIQEKKSDPQFLAQLFEELKGAPVYDPLRNMLIQSFHNLNNTSNRSFNDTESNDGDNEMENEDSALNNLKVDDDNQILLNSSAHSGYQNTENIHQTDLVGNSSSLIDNIRDAEIVKSLLLNSKDMKTFAYKFLMDSNLPDNIEQKNKSKDLRNERMRQQQQQQQQLLQLQLKQQQQQQQPKHQQIICEQQPHIDYVRVRPDSYIINYTLTRIRKEIRSVSQIDDSTIIRIVKMTVTILEDAIANLRQSSPTLASSLKLDRIKISPKEIYSKMKNFNKRDKEHFLASYQSYLSRVITEDCNVNLVKPARPENNNSFDSITWSSTNNNNDTNYANMSGFHSNLPFPEIQNSQKQGSKSNISLPDVKVMNSSEIHQHQDIDSPCTNNSNNMMNDDLAEADQICSSSTAVSVGAVGGGVVGRSSIGDSISVVRVADRHNSEIDVLTNDQIIINSDDGSCRQENNDRDNDDNDIIDCCDNDEVEDDQIGASALNFQPIELKNTAQNRYYKENKSMEMENNENIMHDQHHSNLSAEEHHNDIVNLSNSNEASSSTLIFPISIQSDSMINNNLDSGYQSHPQPDSSSNISTSSNIGSVTNGSNDFTSTNCGKRNSVP